MTKQQEANIRVPNHAFDLYTRKEYESIKQIANNFYERGQDYTDGIQDLLRQLLRVTGWEEALARAIKELLEGPWFKEFPELYEKLNQIPLWPSQRYALGQAIYILQNQGCALIADPTGSGKTKLITTLQLLLVHWLWETGRKNKSYPLIICPPLVQDTWRQEGIDAKFMQTSPISTGLLSYARNSSSKSILKGIEVANILTIDEAHHFLNATSHRSRKIAKHNSDFIILSTATPISRKAKDLLRLIEILDVDNLSDEDLKTFKKLRRGRTLKEEELTDLRSYVSKFLVRRTKAELKKLIKDAPEQYKDRNGNLCQYPETKNEVYDTGETEQDRHIAAEIAARAKELKGLVYLGKEIRRSEFYSDVPDAKYIEMRLAAAKALATFHVQATLRSSRVALVEFVEGTKATSAQFDFHPSKSASGDMLGTLKRHSGSLPKSDFPAGLLPPWLTNLPEYQQECERERAIYVNIASLAKQISDSREISKVNNIIQLLKEHKLMIAFDGTIITLYYLKKIIEDRNLSTQVCVVTGNTEKKDTTLRYFEFGSEHQNVLGLFSDWHVRGGKSTTGFSRGLLKHAERASCG